MVTHSIIFPNLFEMTETLLRYLDAEKDSRLRPFNYPQLMVEKGVEDTAEELVASLVLRLESYKVRLSQPVGEFLYSFNHI